MRETKGDFLLESMQKTIDCGDIIEEEIDALIRKHKSRNEVIMEEDFTLLLGYIRMKQKTQELHTLKEISAHLKRLED